MACILKLPTPGAKGVVVFTTPERDRAIAESPDLRAAILALKGRWAVGLHHNWHDWAFSYDPLFDFSMAGEDDLCEASGRPVPLLTLDACNFVPSFFRPGGGDRFWDVLYVARAVFFKRLPEFFQVVRRLYDAGGDVRVLCICPLPPYDPAEEGSVFYGVRAEYERLFSHDEQGRFNLLPLETRYPFPFDLETLAHFYRSAKVFVHLADDERRCRVAAYAWASGLPVVGTSAVGSLLPRALRRRPWYYEAARVADFPRRIEQAVAEASPEADFEPVRREVAEEFTTAELRRRLVAFTGGEAPEEAFSLAQLDIRLGRHHGVSSGVNDVGMPLGELVALLAAEPPALAQAFASSSDPERFLAAPSQREPSLVGRLARRLGGR